MAERHGLTTEELNQVLASEVRRFEPDLRALANDDAGRGEANGEVPHDDIAPLVVVASSRRAPFGEVA